MAQTRRRALRCQEFDVRQIIFFVLIGIITAGSLAAEEMSVDEWERYYDEAMARLEEHAARVDRGEVPPIKCANPIFSSLYWSQPKGVEGKALAWERRDDLPLTYGTPNFLLHFTTTGPDSVYEPNAQDSIPGIPNYVFEAGKILDSVWEHTVGTMGFGAPISDGWYNGGGDGRLDVYIVDLWNFRAYGASVPESIYTVTPTITATGYMFLENDYHNFQGYEFRRLDALRVTAAHEFFHTVQFAVDAIEYEDTPQGLSFAWSEMSATYMEEEHYDDINDYYGYLSYFYDFPQWSLRIGAGSNEREYHMYASVVFPIFLAERFGSGIIKNIWDSCGAVSGANWWLATDDVIRDLSNDTLDLEDEFQEFALWNLFTGEPGNRARTGSFFPEAENYDLVKLSAQITSYPASFSPAIDSLRPDNLGANYLLLENTRSLISGLGVAFNGDPSQPWGITVVGMQNNVNLPIYVDHIRGDTVTSIIRFQDAANYDRVGLIISVLGGNFLEIPYSVTVTHLQEGVLRPTGGEELYAGITYDIRWYFENSGDSVQIDFSSDNGQVWGLVAVTENDLVYEWLVPEVASDSCLIRITDLGPGGASDVSDDVFSIITASESKVFEPFPNPAWVQKHQAVNFKGEYAFNPENPGAKMTVVVMTLAGEKVWEGENESVSGPVLVSWEFKNEAGELVAAGPYLAVINFQGETVVKKFVVLR
jgi:hypothetical protein